MSTPPPPEGSKPPSSLAAWKSGADKMASAAAGDHLSKSMPAAKQRPAKPKSGSGSKASAAAPVKPWAEQSLAERYGSKPKTVGISKQLRDVLRYLEAHQERGCISWEEITTHGIPPWYDIVEGGELYNLLTSEEAKSHVVATLGGFAYRNEHGIVDRASLLRHIRSHPEGVRANEVRDGYSTVLEDADALRVEGAVFKIYNAEFKVDVFFPVPQRHMHGLPTELAAEYLKTQPPSEPSELIEDLTAKFKLRSAMANLVSSRKPIALMKADKPKKKRKLNIRHITNVHMAHLLADTAQYTSID